MGIPFIDLTIADHGCKWKFDEPAACSVSKTLERFPIRLIENRSSFCLGEQLYPIK
jgi:hypothetical protein